MSTFAQELKKLRKEKRITQRKLAELIDVDFSYISKMENDKLIHAPSETILRKIASVLQVDADSLIVLANKVPSNLQNNIVHDELVVDFLRVAPQMTDKQRGTIKKIIEDVKEGKNNDR